MVQKIFKSRFLFKGMEVPLPEIIDRLSILKLKIENRKNPQFEEEFKACEEAIKEFERKGYEIKREWLKELYEINKHQWGLESFLRKAKEKNNLSEAGKIYIRLQLSNKKRVAIKNKIFEETGSGSHDIKVN